jgi:hypothetical protein
MTVTIQWVPPTNPLVGSVLVYRATNSQLEALGSRTVINTIGAKTVTGSWVTSYTDSGGDSDSLYRVQFWDGVGSSSLSDIIGNEYSELLCNFEDVVRVAQLRNHDIGSEELYYAIKDATDTVFYNFGDPIKRSAIYIDSQPGLMGQTYAFAADMAPVYQIRELYVDSVYPRLVSNQDYQVDYTNGYIKFNPSFLGSYQGRIVTVQWVPMTYHILIKHMAALALVEGELVFSGANTNSPYVQKLTRKIDEIKDVIRPKGLYSTKTDNILTDYDFVAQKIDRTSLYFNY